MKVSMIGTGYVGLVSGVCFAEIGHDVTCIDINLEIIKKLNNGEIPIYEPGLREILVRNKNSERIKFTENYESVKEAKVVFLAVGTPSTSSGEADLQYVYDSATQCVKLMKENSILVLKSTVPVGTHNEIREIIKNNTSKIIHVVNNPEFLKEGSAIDDFMKPDRVVIGHENETAADIMVELYGPLVRQGNPILKMSNASAEVTKYASNAMLATKITFINEIAKLCDLTNADVEEVRRGMISDQRIGKHFLMPGPGFGGSCFPKDVRAIIHTGKKYGLDVEIAQTVDRVNEIQKLYMFEKIKNHYKGDLAGKVFAFWGVSFKPDTDDVRESPAIKMAKNIIEMGGRVNYYDPEGATNYEVVMERIKTTKGKTKKFQDKYDCLNGADALLVVTEWGEFRAPNFQKIKSSLKELVIFDARNIYNTQKILEHGFAYYAIGKHVPKCG